MIMGLKLYQITVVYRLELWHADDGEWQQPSSLYHAMPVKCAATAKTKCFDEIARLLSKYQAQPFRARINTIKQVGFNGKLSLQELTINLVQLDRVVRYMYRG